MRPTQQIAQTVTTLALEKNGLNHHEAVRYDEPHGADTFHMDWSLPPHWGGEMSTQRSTNSESPKRRRAEGESRQEKLARIKAEIEAGTYDSDEKLEAAIDRMLGVLMMDE